MSIDVLKVLPRLKENKAVGTDMTDTEAYIYGSPRLFAHLGILFTWFIRHTHLPGKFLQSILIPLVKNIGGDLSDVDNYRAIMVSNAITKVFEFVLLDQVMTAAHGDEYQFGF